MLAQLGLAPSRSRARDMIARGCVIADGAKVVKAGSMLTADAQITIDDPGSNYVSRAALKLVAGLDAAGIDAQGKHALDIGASTGGFTQVLLERGAASVLAIDVGHGQMVPEIANDPRVTNIEGLNARDLSSEHLAVPPDLIVSDVSFISLKLAAEPALRLAAAAECVLLVKPQFEVGRDGIGKGGLVTDEALVQKTLEDITDWFSTLPGWTMTKRLPSPITGGDGNKEYLLCGEQRAR